MRRRVVDALLVLALVIPLVMLAGETLLYAVASETAEGAVTDLRTWYQEPPFTPSYRAEIAFTTATGDEIAATKLVQPRPTPSVTIRYLPLNPRLFTRSLLAAARDLQQGRWEVS